MIAAKAVLHTSTPKAVWYKANRKKGFNLLSAFLTEKWQSQNFGREIVFSADLCYNGANEKPSSGREPLALCIFRGMGFARSLCNTKAKLAIKQNDK